MHNAIIAKLHCVFVPAARVAGCDLSVLLYMLVISKSLIGIKNVLTMGLYTVSRPNIDYVVMKLIIISTLNDRAKT